MENVGISRRNILKAAAIGVGGVLISGTLAGCASDPASQINSANEQLINSLNLDETLLPIGSVVETEAGRYMIVGNKALWREGGFDAPLSVYDYYATRWPAGNITVYQEHVYSAVFNKEDINKVLFIGYFNDESQEFRDYIKGWDTTKLNDYQRGSGFRVTAGSSACETDTRARMEGKRSPEIYGEKGNEFNGGLLFSEEGDQQ